MTGDRDDLPRQRTDAEDGDLSGGALTWKSNNAGKIISQGTGNAFSHKDLASGTHTLTAEDGQGVASHSFTINAVRISDPIPKPRLEERASP